MRLLSHSALAHRHCLLGALPAIAHYTRDTALPRLGRAGPGYRDYMNEAAYRETWETTYKACDMTKRAVALWAQAGREEEEGELPLDCGRF